MLELTQRREHMYAGARFQGRPVSHQALPRAAGLRQELFFSVLSATLATSSGDWQHSNANTHTRTHSCESREEQQRWLAALRRCVNDADDIRRAVTVGSVVLSKPLFFRRGPDRHRRGSSEAVAPRNVSHGVWEDDGSDADEAWEEGKNGDGDDAGESGYGQMKLHVYFLLCTYDLDLYVCTSATDVYA